MQKSKWWRIGGSLFAGLFVAYLDRTNLSVAMPQLSRDLGFAGQHFAVTASWTLTIFLIGYALANILGGIVTRGMDPKAVVIWCFAIWSAATLVVGFTGSVAVLLMCRLILGVAEGIYWPQQSRFVHGWFAENELTKANAIIQFYGQYFALAIGFMLLTPIYDAFGWHSLFFATGGIGLVLIVPLFLAMLRPESEAPYRQPASPGPQPRPTLQDLGGPAFLLLVFSYVTQGMLFWGITLWIPLAVRTLGFTGLSQGLACAVPYAAAILLAVPLSAISDRTGKRVLIASLGMLVAGVLLLLLPVVESGGGKLALITVALGYYAGSFTPNIWSILQCSVEPRAVGSASGIMNGLGAGGGGTIAGFLVGIMNSYTGSYMSGFMVLGALVILGSFSLLIYGHVVGREPALRGNGRALPRTSA
jgi:MFS family permease